MFHVKHYFDLKATIACISIFSPDPSIFFNSFFEKIASAESGIKMLKNIKSILLNKNLLCFASVFLLLLFYLYNRKGVKCHELKPDVILPQSFWIE